MKENTTQWKQYEELGGESYHNINSYICNTRNRKCFEFLWFFFAPLAAAAVIG